MSTIGRFESAGDAAPQGSSVKEILSDNGWLLVVVLILVSAVTFAAYEVFDFDLIWVVAVPLIAAGLVLGGTVLGPSRPNGT